MARRIKEEHVTKAILEWLMNNGWEIICFDFPQSGTGKVLHPDDTSSKTEGAIIPDIVAIRGMNVVYFENKDRFVLEDFNKLQHIRDSHLYDRAFALLLSDCEYENTFYGAGMPYSDQNHKKALDEINKVDFVTFLKEDGTILLEGPAKIIF